jgi:cell division protein ZapA (FtsZ GTPase activity inhibitor)
MTTKRAVAVRIRGQEFRVLTDADEDWLQRVAGYLDETMATVEERTGTVDSLDVAMLTALNLARELVEIRERGPIPSPKGPESGRLRGLIELAESALRPEAR